MTNAKYFTQVLQEFAQFGHFEINLDALPFALLRSQDEVRIDRIIPALKRTAKAGMVSSPSLWLHDVELPAQVAGQLIIIAASRLQALISGTASTEVKESVYIDAFYVFCLAYSAEDETSFDLVIDQQRGESIFLPPLPAAVA
jgi:hypothetical protein